MVALAEARSANGSSRPVIIQTPHEVGYVASPLDGIDPAVRDYVRLIDPKTITIPQPLDQKRFGVAPIPTIPQVVSARLADTDKVRLLAEKMPPRDDLLVNIDTVPGGLMIPFVAAVVNGTRDVFHPDKSNITAKEFKDAARRVHGIMRVSRKKDLAALFHDKKGIVR